MTHHPLSPVTLTLLHDAARCLALAERGELTALRDGGLHRASWQLLHSHVAGAPHGPRPLAETAAPVLSWLFRALGHGGLLGVINGQLRLSRTAHDWLALPAAGQVAALRQIWRNAPEVAWAWLAPAHGTPARDRAWAELTRQLMTTVAALPVDAWVLAAEMAADLTAPGQAWGVGVERNLPRVRQALARQAAQLATFLLTELLPQLGVVAVQPQGNPPCLAVTAEGADWLAGALRTGKTAAHWPADTDLPVSPEPAASEPAWQVADDLRLTIPLAAPAAATFEALQFADLLTLGPPAQYQVSRASLERGVSHGYEPPDIRFLLAHGAGQPLSGPAMAQLNHWQEELAVIHCEPGYRLRPAAPTLVARLRDREPFRDATELAASGRWAFVSQPEAPALLRYLRRLGYVLQLVGSSPAGTEEPPPLAPLLRRRLPLVPLATLVGGYGRLRARVPGLADLGLADLERMLLAALAPAEQAAVARLVAANDAFLTPRLGQPAAAADDDEPAPPPDEPGHGPAHSSAADAQRANLQATLTAAIAQGATLELLYADTQGAVTQRPVRPLRLETRWGRQYLVAHCELRGAERSFRLDRIVEVLYT